MNIEVICMCLVLAIIPALLIWGLVQERESVRKHDKIIKGIKEEIGIMKKEREGKK